MTDAQCVAIMVTIMRAEMGIQVQMIRLKNGIPGGLRPIAEDIKTAKELLLTIKNSPLDDSLYG